MSLYVGIDPGLSGAIAIFDLEKGSLVIHDMPTLEIKVGKSNKNVISERQLVSILDEPKGAIAFCEKVNAMPGQGVTSMFNFGFSALRCSARRSHKLWDIPSQSGFSALPTVCWCCRMESAAQ